MFISPETNKFKSYASIFPGLSEIKKALPLVAEPQKQTNPVPTPLQDPSDLPEDRLLNFLQAHGIIDDQWQLTESYRGIELTDMAVDEVQCNTLLKSELFGSVRHKHYKFRFIEFLYYTYLAGSKTLDALKEFTLHGSFASPLIGINSLKKKLKDEFPGIEPYLTPLNPSFPYSDIDLKLKSGSEKEKQEAHFTDRLAKEIAGKIVEGLHYEISESFGDSRQVSGFSFADFTKYLLHHQGHYWITDIRIYHKESPCEIAHFNYEKDSGAFTHLLALSRHPQKIKKYLTDRFVKTEVSFAYARPVFMMDRDGRMLAEGETVKVLSEELEVDLFYKREGIAVDSRVEHQKLSVELLPFFKKDQPFEVKGSLQGVLDLVCGIGHWTKADNDADDWCAYLFMITRGIRFPAQETSDLLKEIVLKLVSTPENSLRKHLMGFKKLLNQSIDFHAVYMLNACARLNLDLESQRLLFENIVPESESLRTLLGLLTNGRMSLKTARAVLTFVAYRALMMPEEAREGLLFKIQMTQQEGKSIFRFKFDQVYFSVGMDVKQAWKEIAAYGHLGDAQQDDLKQLLRSMGGLQHITFAGSNVLEKNLKKLPEGTELTAEKIEKHYAGGNAVLNRMATYLLFSRVVIQHDVKALCLLLTKFCYFKKDQPTLELLIAFKFLLHKRDYLAYEGCLKILFNDQFLNPKDLMHDLLFFENDLFFNKGIELLRENPFGVNPIICFAAAKEQILRNKAGKAMAILEILSKQRLGNESLWKPLLNQIIAILNKSNHRPEDIVTFQMRVLRMAQIVLEVLTRLNVQEDFIEDWAAYNNVLSFIQHEEISVKLKQCAKDVEERTKEARLQDQIVAMEKAPTSTLALHLLTAVQDRPQLLHSIFIKFLEGHFSSSRLPSSLPILLDLLSESRFHELFSKVGPHSRLIELLNPILKKLFTGREHFEFIGTLLSLDYNYPKDHYFSFLKMALELPVTAESEVKFNQVSRRLRNYPLSKEEKAKFILIETAFEAKPEKSRKENAQQNLSLKAQTFLGVIEGLEPVQRGSFLFDFYRLLVGLSKTAQNLKSTHEALALIKSQMDSKTFGKDLQTKIKEIDFFLLNLMFKHYEAPYYGFAFALMSLFLESKPLAKGELNSLKTMVKNCVRIVPQPDDPFAKFLTDLFDHLCNNLGNNANYLLILDSWVAAEPSNTLVLDLLKRLDNLDAVFKNIPSKTLPPYILKFIQITLDKSDSWDHLKLVSTLITQTNFEKYVDSETHKKVMSRYFSLIAHMIFAAEGPFSKTIEQIWNSINLNITTNFTKCDAQDIGRPLDAAHQNWLGKVRQTVSIGASASGIAQSVVLTLHEILLKMYKPIAEVSAETEAIWEEHFVLIDNMSKTFDSIHFVQNSTTALSQKVLLLLLETIISIKPTTEALVVARNAFVMHLFNQMKDITDLEFIRLFDLYVYLDQNSLKTVGVACHYYPLRQWYMNYAVNTFLVKLPIQRRLKKEVEYKGMILGSKETLLQYQDVSKTLFAVLDQMRATAICYHSMLTINLFETIQKNVDANHNLLYMIEIERAINQCNKKQVTQEYYYDHCINLITATKNLMNCIRKGTITLEDFSDPSNVEIVFHAVKDVFPLMRNDYAAIFSLRVRLGTLLNMLPEDLSKLIDENLSALHEILDITDCIFREKVEDVKDDLAAKYKICLDYFEELKKFIKSIDDSASAPIKENLAEDILILWSGIFATVLDLTTEVKTRSLQKRAFINACSALAFCQYHNYFKGNETIYLDCVDGLLSLMPDMLGELMIKTDLDGPFAKTIFNIFIKTPHAISRIKHFKRCIATISKTLVIVEKACPPLYEKYMTEIEANYPH